MRFRFFAHSWLSDWNHGNAHFLRGLTEALARRGHEVRVYEEVPGPGGGWSLANLLTEPGGAAAIAQVRAAFPRMDLRFYGGGGPLHPALAALGVPRVRSWREELRGAEWVIAHEWNPPELFHWLLAQRQRHGFRCLLHNTHHRAVTEATMLERTPVAQFDGVLAFGESLRKRYAQAGAKRSFVFHEAADTGHFRPGAEAPTWDVAWIGNWGDEERTAELEEYLLGPVQRLGLRAQVFGVRYPAAAVERLQACGISFGGYLPNLAAPAVYARAKVAVHIPRRPYAQALPGIPTIRVFEALACGAALVCAPWNDCEALFEPGRDFASVADGAAMTAAVEQLIGQEEQRRQWSARGAAAIAARHTCAHRAQELEAICQTISREARPDPAPICMSSAPA